MGVLACHRAGCRNVMCDNDLLGNYICDDCVRDLKEQADSWPHRITRGELEDRINQFFKSTKVERGEIDPSLVDRDAELESMIYRRRWD